MAKRVHVREIYLYIICIIAIILFIVGITTIFDSAFTYVNPVSYKTWVRPVSDYESQYPDCSKEEINELIEEERQNSIDNEKTFALRGLIRGGIFIFMAIPLFIFHWRKAQAMWRISEE
ncbi:MAG: hypothetical protein K8S14_09085 [Actinomycetia bacterium]|nr:hypothetical protein [Actinomycetes bacterium]